MPKILFGTGNFSKLPELLSLYGSSVAIITGKSSFSTGSNAEALYSALRKGSVEFRVLNIPYEPTPELIDASISELRRFNPEVVTAIGGGSVLDAGKAIAAMLTVNDGIINYLEEVGTMVHPGTRLPLIAVPTTAGTGSEATKNSVISRIGRDGFKKSIRHDNFVPDIALVDPELTIECPPQITAASGMDCFSQLVEAYLSTKANEYTDALATEGLKAVKYSLLRAYRDLKNIDARTGMSFAALTSGICLSNAGLGTVHGCASSIGGLYSIPHGLICGTLMAATNHMNVKKLRSSGDNPAALIKYSTLGRLFIDETGKPDEFYVNGFINFLYELTDSLNLPKLEKYGITDSDLEFICSETQNKNNPVRLTKEEIGEIVTSRLR